MTMDSWVGCALNKTIQPKGQIGAEIYPMFPSQSHALCGLAGSYMPEPQPTPSLHSPALQTLIKAFLRMG